jgi:ankyrin repeat protein
MHAAHKARTDVLALLLQRGALVESRDNAGRTPLRHAGFYRTQVETLLAQGANVNSQDDEGNTALMRAAHYARQKAINNLLMSGADVNIRNIHGKTALMFAAVDAPAGEMSVPGHARDDKLEAASKAENPARSYRDRAEAVRFLLEHGADPSQRDNEGRTALDMALAQARVVGDVNAEVVAVLRDAAKDQAEEPMSMRGQLIRPRRGYARG